MCCATSRPVCRSHCTDRPLLARAAGSITIPTGIDRSINPEQLDLSAVRSACRRAAIVGLCGARARSLLTRGHGDRTAGALHVHVWSCPGACAPYSCTRWTLWAVQLKNSAQGARHVRCRGPALSLHHDVTCVQQPYREIVRDCARILEVDELATASVTCIIAAAPWEMLSCALESDGSLFPKLPVHHKVRTP